jgi:Skp family chaperone for outer membrane proteins
MNRRPTVSTRVLPLLATIAVCAAALAGCATAPKSDIGLIDTQRLQANWPKFQNYQNQIAADNAAIVHSNKSAAEKRREMGDLEKRYVSAQQELVNDVQDAAKQVQSDRHLKYVFTRQYVGYGGVDITGDVEKILHIDDKGTPAP